jgi:hypothetical protein
MPQQRLLVGCDPLHRYLLPGEDPPLTHWQSLTQWSELLNSGALDAVLVSVAAMAQAKPSLEADSAKQAAAEQLQTLASADLIAGVHWMDGLSAMPLGIQSLLLLHASQQQRAAAEQGGPRPWQLLLPPADQQPRLQRDLQQLGLLPLGHCSALDDAGWLQQLQAEPYLLPAQLSLLEQAPWREAALKAVPPPEPLEEQLWLLVRQGEERWPAIEALVAQLRERVLKANPADG